MKLSEILFPSDIKDVPMAANLKFFKWHFPKPFVRLSWNFVGGNNFYGDSDFLKWFSSDIQDGSHLETLQTTSPKPYVGLNWNWHLGMWFWRCQFKNFKMAAMKVIWMYWFWQIWIAAILKFFKQHLHTNDKFNPNLARCIGATWRLRIAKIVQSWYSRWLPWRRGWKFIGLFLNSIFWGWLSMESQSQNTELGRW